MLQIVKVELKAAEHLLHGIGVAIVERRIRGYTRTNLIQTAIARIVLHNLVDVVFALWSWSDKGHVTDKDVVELGQFIKMVNAEESTHLRKAVVFLVLEKLWTVLLSVHTHTAELVDVEWAAKPADTLLLEYGRTAIFHLHRNIADEE